jgi:hypothetical protein
MTALPVLMRNAEVIGLKKVAFRAGKSEKTISRGYVSDGIGRPPLPTTDGPDGVAALLGATSPISRRVGWVKSPEPLAEGPASKSFSYAGKMKIKSCDASLNQRMQPLDETSSVGFFRSLRPGGHRKSGAPARPAPASLSFADFLRAVGFSRRGLFDRPCAPAV